MKYYSQSTACFTLKESSRVTWKIL